MKRWISAAFSGAVVSRSLKVSLVVGTILVAINQGDSLIEGVIKREFFWKVPLTFLVPYCVSTYASVSTLLANET